VYAVNANSLEASSPQKVGGWYPVFFDTYSSKKVNQIIYSIKKGDVDKISITFDNNAVLALKIKNRINAKTKFPIELQSIHQNDDKTVQYNHEQVVVTVWNK
jgi:endonuclease G